MSASRTPVVVTRDCVVTTIPYGDSAQLSAGDRVVIMQTLGGSVTVRTERGYLVRIDGADADAVGMSPQSLVGIEASDEPFKMSTVMEALGTVYDPEIPISIVELGLVYRCEEIEGPDDTRLISIDMSMTAPGCGMGDILRADAAKVVRMCPGVDDVDVTLVWDPPWDISRMSDAARLELGML